MIQPRDVVARYSRLRLYASSLRRLFPNSKMRKLLLIPFQQNEGFVCCNPLQSHTIVPFVSRSFLRYSRRTYLTIRIQGILFNWKRQNISRRIIVVNKMLITKVVWFVGGHHTVQIILLQIQQRRIVQSQPHFLTWNYIFFSTFIDPSRHSLSKNVDLFISRKC